MVAILIILILAIKVLITLLTKCPSSQEIPPRSELSVEMHQFFCLLDRDADGLLSYLP